MSFAELDTKQKALIIGGGGLVGFFLLRSVFGNKAPVSVAPAMVPTTPTDASTVGAATGGGSDITTQLADTLNAFQDQNAQQIDKLGQALQTVSDSTTTLFGQAQDTNQRNIDNLTASITSLNAKMGTPAPIITAPATSPANPTRTDTFQPSAPPATIVPQIVTPAASQSTQKSLSDVIAQTKINAQAYNLSTTTAAQKTQLHEANVALLSGTGATYDPGSGKWMLQGKVINV